MAGMPVSFCFLIKPFNPEREREREREECLCEYESAGECVCV